MKKIIMSFMIVIFLIEGCSNSNDTYTTSGEIAKQQSRSIIEYIENKNTEALKDMFCEYIKKNHDLDNEIEKLSNYIHGEIISYDEPYGSETSKSWKPYAVQELLLTGHISNIKTDKGKTYRISFNSYHTYTENEDYVGISFIVIQESDIYDNDLVSLDNEVWVGEVLKD